MLTGTPLDLTPFGPLLSALGLLYWAVALGAAGLALWLPRSWWVKLPTASFVVAAFVYPVIHHIQALHAQQKQKQARLDAATMHFEMRCKSAGEKITRTIENVDGVFLMRLRSRSTPTWFEKKDTTYDVFASEDGGDATIGSVAINYKQGLARPDNYIMSFLRPQIVDPPNPQTGVATDVGQYRYIEAIDPIDAKLYRYTAKSIQLKKLFSEYGDWVREVRLDREPITRHQAKYAVTWRDLTEPADREWWIAGSEIRIVDLMSGEVIAERTGYVMDFAQGDKKGFRSPWAFAQPCPMYQPAKRQTRYFVERVLKPTQGEYS